MSSLNVKHSQDIYKQARRSIDFANYWTKEYFLKGSVFNSGLTVDILCSCALVHNIYCRSVFICLYHILQQYPHEAETYFFCSLHRDHHMEACLCCC